MAKAKTRIARKSLKRRKGGRTPARKKVAKRARSKKVRSKVRTTTRGGRKSIAKKTRSPITARKALRKPPRQRVQVPVEDTIVDVVDEPTPGVIRVTEDETIRTIPPDPNDDSDTEE